MTRHDFRADSRTHRPNKRVRSVVLRYNVSQLKPSSNVLLPAVDAVDSKLFQDAAPSTSFFLLFFKGAQNANETLQVLALFVFPQQRCRKGHQLQAAFPPRRLCRPHFCLRNKEKVVGGSASPHGSSSAVTPTVGPRTLERVPGSQVRAPLQRRSD